MSACSKCRRRHVTRYNLPACTGHRAFDGPGVRLPKPVPCKNPPMHGQHVCRYHGGAAPQNLAAGARAHGEEQAAKAMRRFGGPIDTTPTEALLDAVRWTAGYVAWLRDKVAEIDADRKLVWGVTKKKSGGDDRGVTREAGANAWLVLLGTWHDKLVRVCAEAIRAGIEERRVRLAEQQGALVADVIKRILDDLGLSDDQVALVSEVVPRHLRLLTA